MKNTIETYIALNNPKEAVRVLELELGAPKVTGHADLIRKIHYATEKFGLSAFNKLAMIDTPYRRLILSQIDEKKSNCGGCSGADGDKAVVENQGGKPPIMSDASSKNNGLLIAGVVLLGVMTIAVLVK